MDNKADENIYKEFKKTEIMDSSTIDLSKIKDGSYVILKGKLTGTPVKVETQYLKPNNIFLYVEEEKKHFVGGKYGWHTDNDDEYYGTNIKLGNVPINLKDFYVDKECNYISEYIKDDYKKYFQGNSNDGDISLEKDSKIVFYTIKNNVNTMAFAKVENGKLVHVSNTGKNEMVIGNSDTNNYNKLEDTYKTSINTDNIGTIMILVFIWFIAAIFSIPVFFKKRG